MRSQPEATSQFRTLALASLLTASACQTNDRFHVMTFNLRTGLSDAVETANGHYLCDPARAAEFAASMIRATCPGRALVGMQEVDINVPRKGPGCSTVRRVDVPAAIDSHLPAEWSYYFGYAIQGDDSLYGNCNAYNVFPLAEQRWPLAWDANNQFQYGEQPMTTVATKHFFGAGRTLWFVNVHLHWKDGGHVAVRQLYQVLGRIKTFDPDIPVVLLGDFNIKGNWPPFRDMSKLLGSSDGEVSQLSGFKRVAEIQGGVYDQRVDFVFLYNPNPDEPRLVVVDTKEFAPEHLGVLLSDHRVLTVEFEWQ